MASWLAVPTMIYFISSTIPVNISRKLDFLIIHHMYHNCSVTIACHNCFIIYKVIKNIFFDPIHYYGHVTNHYKHVQHIPYTNQGSFLLSLFDDNKIKMVRKKGKRQKENPVGCNGEGNR